MLRVIKQFVLGVILLALALMGVANRESVTINLLPEPLMPLLPFDGTLSLPLFLILGAAILVGLLIGYLLEYLRETKHRRAVTQRQREVSKLETEVAALRREAGKEKDDVLALLN